MINFLLLIAGMVLAFWFIGNALGFITMLLVAGLVGFAAEAMVPGRQVAHGWLGAMGAGLIGSWVGTMLIGHKGPMLGGLALFPALLGAVILVLAVSFLRKKL